MKKIIILILSLLFFNFYSYSQGYKDNPFNTWGVTEKSRINRGAVVLTSADTNSEKIFYSLNKAENIPGKVWGLQNLKVLNLSNSYNSCCPSVGSVSDKLNTLAQLEYIYFQGLGIESLPTDLSNLVNLKSIYVVEAPKVETKLQRLPDFSRLPALEVIYFDLNKKTVLSSAENFSSIFDNSGLKILVLNNVQLSGAAFSSLQQLQDLQILELDGNMFTKLPNLFSNSALQQLSFRSNNLELIDEEIGNLKELQYLEFAYNQIETIPESIGGLNNLILLDVSYNKLTSIPESLKDMDKLEHLQLRGNDFNEIPEVIYEMKNLKELNLLETNITTLDERILNTNIERLRIGGSDFNFDPKMLAKLKSLKTLQTSNSKELLKSKKKLKKLRPDVSI